MSEIRDCCNLKRQLLKYSIFVEIYIKNVPQVAEFDSEIRIFNFLIQYGASLKRLRMKNQPIFVTLLI